MLLSAPVPTALGRSEAARPRVPGSSSLGLGQRRPFTPKEARPRRPCGCVSPCPLPCEAGGHPEPLEQGDGACGTPGWLGACAGGRFQKGPACPSLAGHSQASAQGGRPASGAVSPLPAAAGPPRPVAFVSRGHHEMAASAGRHFVSWAAVAGGGEGERPPAWWPRSQHRPCPPPPWPGSGLSPGQRPACWRVARSPAPRAPRPLRPADEVLQPRVRQSCDQSHAPGGVLGGLGPLGMMLPSGRAPPGLGNGHV